jgi:hypothetical protein
VPPAADDPSWSDTSDQSAGVDRSNTTHNLDPTYGLVLGECWQDANEKD